MAQNQTGSALTGKDGEVSEMDKKCKQCEYFDCSYDVCKHPCGSRSYDDVGEEDVCEQFTNKQNSMTHEEAIPFIDREKVIKGLECCKWSRQNVKPEKVKCDECPYKDQSIMNAFSVWRSCTNVLAGDALALLKEKEAKTAITNPEKYGDHLRHCPSCKTVLPISSQYGKAKFCHLCGQAVKWSD